MKLMRSVAYKSIMYTMMSEYITIHIISGVNLNTFTSYKSEGWILNYECNISVSFSIKVLLSSVEINASSHTPYLAIARYDLA